jgi:thiol-disulfide isomerase/thioredoxin
MLLLSCGSSTPEINTSVDNAETAALPITVDYEGLESYLNNRTSDFQVINFWATWCKPCVEEMPYFKELHETIKAENGEVILVSLDFSNQIESKLIPYIEKESLVPDVVVLDDPKANIWIDKVSPEWSGAIPATLIKKGEKSIFHEGKYASYEMLLEHVTSLTKL